MWRRSPGTGDPESAGREVDVGAYLEDLNIVTIERGRAAAQMLAGDVDLGVVVFVGPDRISHRAWPDQDAVVAGKPSPLGPLVESCYRTLDAAIESGARRCGSRRDGPGRRGSRLRASTVAALLHQPMAAAKQDISTCRPNDCNAAACQAARGLRRLRSV